MPTLKNALAIIALVLVILFLLQNIHAVCI